MSELRKKPLIYKQLQDYIEDMEYEELLEVHRRIGDIMFRNIYKCGFSDCPMGSGNE